LRVHGGSSEVLDAIRKNDLNSSALTDCERVLLGFARKVNIRSHEIIRQDVDLLYRSGWSEMQVSETVHVAALFSTFNRVANAFGLESQGLLSLFNSGPDAELSGITTIERISQ
jgi:alkylhydroperoxidase family enzyme